MIKLPVPLGMFLCNSFHVDAASSEISLRGVLASLRFRRFPTPPISMSFFCYLTDGKGEGEMKLEVLRMFSNKPPEWIWRARRWFVFPDDPLLQVPVNFDSKSKLLFPAPGDYLVPLPIDSSVIVERTLPVFRKKGKS
jgi:hypothetical protein